MTDKLIKEVFPDFEKWDAFIELTERRADIESIWINEYRKKLAQAFVSEFKEWQINYDSRLNIYINTKGCANRQSLEMWIENGWQFSFWANISLFDPSKTKTLIKNELSLIERELNQVITIIENPSDSYAFKVGLNYELPFRIKQYDINRLMFYADKQLPDEIMRILRPILLNEAIVNLFKRVSSECMKNGLI